MSKPSRRVPCRARAASLVLVAGLAAGCSADVSQFADHYLGVTENQKSIIAGAGRGASDDVVTGSTGRQPSADTSSPGRSAAQVARADLPPMPPVPGTAPSASAGGWSSHQGDVRQNPDEAPAMATRDSASTPQPMRRSDPIRTSSLPPAGGPSSATSAPRTKSGWSASGGTVVTVGAGEDGETVARRYGVPLKAILEANNLASADRIWPGRRVVIPSYAYAAANAGASAGAASDRARDVPVPQFKPGRGGNRSDHAAARARPAVTGERYVVRPSDSVASIAARFKVATSDLRAANGMDPSARLWIGQKLQIPAAGGSRVARAGGAVASDADSIIAAVPAAKPVRVARNDSRTVPPPPAAPKQAEAAPPPAAPRPSSQVVASRQDAAAEAEPDRARGTVAMAADGQRIFAWPADGPVISRFGRKASGERNDGINISVPKGAPVRSAGDGVVIYSGNELKGYGNLVLVRHEAGWVSAYAHNASLSVQRGDSVRKGQVIAAAGATGSVAEPQVHFELRRNSKPVDPLPLLAAK